MKAVFYILTKPTLLQELLNALHENGINGGTIFETKGMGTELARHSEFKVTGVLRSILRGEQLNMSNTLMFIVPDDRVEIVARVIKAFAGDMTQPDSGILFSFPIDYIEGLKT